MDNKAFVNKFTNRLKDIFCKTNNKKKKYAEVWLTKEDFDGMYQSGKYVLNVKAEHELPSCSEEISHVNSILFRELTPEERSYIWRIAVYNASDEIHCESEDILVYNEEEKCSQ
jgi:hypothetical protein